MRSLLLELPPLLLAPFEGRGSGGWPDRDARLPAAASQMQVNWL